MKRLLIVLAILFVGLLAAIVAAVLLIDAESFRQPITSYASTSLGREVTLGELDLTLFPLPAVRASQLRIAGHRKDAEPFAEVGELRLRVAVFPLLARRLVLRSVELDAPRIRIPFDKDGNPILPGPSEPPTARSDTKAKPGGTKPESAPSGSKAPDGSEPAPADEPLLAIDRIHIRDASVVAGPYRFSGGTLDGTFSLGGDADLSFELADTSYKQDDVALSGPVHGSLQLGKSWSVDLSEASLVSGESFRKPAGQTLIARGSLGPELSAAALRDATVRLGSNEIPLKLFLERARTEIHVEPASIDLAALQPFLAPDTPALSGRVELDKLQIKLDPLSINGHLGLEGAGAQLEPGHVSVSGPIAANESKFTLLEGSSAKLGDTLVGVSGSYDLNNETARFEFDAKDADVAALISEFTGDTRLSGVLAAGGKFTMVGSGLEGLKGGGNLAIRPGQIEGFSLVHELLGPLAQIGVLFANFKGKDLSRYETQDFERLDADYTLANGVLDLSRLELVYRHATANLKGTVNMVDGALNLRGQVVLSEELGDELSGTKSKKLKVIPIPSIGGTIDQPRVNIDQETLSRAVAAFLVQDRVQSRVDEELDGELGDRLEEKLGPGTKDAIRDIFGTVFGTPPQQKAPAEPSSEPPASGAEGTGTP